jgi:hypothetical protein
LNTYLSYTHFSPDASFNLGSSDRADALKSGPALQDQSDSCSTGIASARQRSMPPARFASRVQPAF